MPETSRPYMASYPPVASWIGELPIFLQYKIKTVQKLKQRFGKAMFGVQAGIIHLDEDMLPGVIIEGLCTEDGAPWDHEATPVTVDMIGELPVPAYRFLLEDFNDAWNCSMPESKKKRLEKERQAANQSSAEN